MKADLEKAEHDMLIATNAKDKARLQAIIDDLQA
jgi:hypothetical protein